VLKSTHEQIVTSDKLTALGEMVSGISHEISTPLVVISDRPEGLEKSLGSGDVRNGQHQLQDLRDSFKKTQ
jgi:C4-dicarboxylate-specific signal transduction histidine kinase